MKALGSAYGAAVYHRDHAGAREHIASMGRERWDALLTFSVLRDPFARLVSCWAFGCGKQIRGDPSPEKFRAWVDAGCPLENRFHLDVGPGRCLWMHAPQVEWLTDADGQLAVAYLFRIETLASEWSRLLGRLGVGQTPLPVANSSQHAEVDDYYGPAEREYVRERYAADFGLLESIARR